MHADLEEYWAELSSVSQRMPLQLVARAAELLMTCHREDKTVFVLGNGGSAATASHFACDLAKGTRTDGCHSFRVVPLTDNMPLLTAWANDVSFDCVFAEQLTALVRPGDVVVVISASGNSSNIVAAARAARGAGATVIAFTGRTGGRVRRLAHLTIPVPADRIELVEDAHAAVAHSLCVALRGQLRAISGAEAETAEPVVLDIAL